MAYVSDCGVFGSRTVLCAFFRLIPICCGVFPVPPNSLEISLSPRVVKVGQKVTITCQSSSSNPASRLSWWRDGDEVTGVIDGGTEPAEHGGWSTVSRLELTPTVDDHGEIYSCRATNTLLEQAVSDAVTLNVLCEYPVYFVKFKMG